MQSRVVAMLAQDVRHQAQADQLAARIGYSQREYAAAHAAGLAGSTAPGTANHSHILPAWRRDDNGGEPCWRNPVCHSTVEERSQEIPAHAIFQRPIQLIETPLVRTSRPS